MRCRDFRLQLSAYQDEEPAPAGGDWQALENHLRNCPTCRAEREEMAELSRLLAVPEPAPDPWFVTRFRERRAQSLQVVGASWKWLAVRLVPVSLATAAAAILTVWIGARPNGELRELEDQALRSGLAAVTEEVMIADRVLGLGLDLE